MAAPGAKRKAKRDFVVAVSRPAVPEGQLVAEDVLVETTPDPLAIQPGRVPPFLAGTKVDRETLPPAYNEALRAAAKASGRPAATRLLKKTARHIDAVNRQVEDKEPPPPGSVSFNDATIRKVFGVLDLDKNGVISAQELRHVFAQLGEMPTDAEIDAMLLVCDPRGEGAVNFEDFANVFINPIEGLRACDVAKVKQLLKPAGDDSSEEERPKPEDSEEEEEVDDATPSGSGSSSAQGDGDD